MCRILSTARAGRYSDWMRPFLAAGFAVVFFCVALNASIIPVFHLDNDTVKAFEDYIAVFEKSDFAQFTSGGKLWIDSVCCGKRGLFDCGKKRVEPRRNEDVAGGSIHHFTGTIHVPGGTIDAVARVMEDYPNYPRYFPPDVVKGSGERMPDSSPGRRTLPRVAAADRAHLLD